ncbi:hypothetical protein B0H11DRAFT_2252261 [Mycena galericulata]|nr:hypothetical protein B0H11DRAFT_2252261 [Mycena galericulata]
MKTHWSGKSCHPPINLPTNLSSPPLEPSPAVLPKCPGAEFPWELDDILDSYPLSIHSRKSRRDPGYTLLSINITTSTIQVRSARCGDSPPADGMACTLCRGLEPSIQAVRKWALQPFGKKPVTRLSFAQLEKKLVSVSKQLKNEQLKKSDHFKTLKRARKKIKTHQQFFDVISTNTIPGLYRLLSNAKTAGWSIEKTIEMALKALQGKYGTGDFDATAAHWRAVTRQ